MKNFWIKSFRLSRKIPVSCVIFLALFLFNLAISSTEFTYYDARYLIGGGIPLAVGALGQTLVVLVGGFDLSAGAVISLTNVVIASNIFQLPADSPALLWVAVGLGIGAFVGALNGFLISFLRLQPIVVTLAVMFIIQGVSLLVMDKPGGYVSDLLIQMFTGELIADIIPNSLILLFTLVAGWVWLKNTRFGIQIYAIGADLKSTYALGTNVVFVKFFTYILAGALYGLAGIFISAQTGSGDPLVGNPLLLSLFAAVVIGGTKLGGGKGGLIGTIFGSYGLVLIVTILFSLNVSAFYTTIVEGGVLLCAVLIYSLAQNTNIVSNFRQSISIPSFIKNKKNRISKNLDFIDYKNIKHFNMPSFLEKNRKSFRFCLPAYGLLLVVIIMTQLLLGNVFSGYSYLNSLITLSGFMIVLALGQGAVILVGGLDLSIPWTITISAIIIAKISNGLDADIVQALAFAILVSASIGFFNGVLISIFEMSPIITTMATNVILQGIVLLYTGGTPTGSTTPALKWFMTSEAWFFSPVAYAVFIFGAFGYFLFHKTNWGSKLLAVGNNKKAAYLSGVPVPGTLISAYVLSSLCAGLAGFMLLGFSGQPSLGMGDEYLLSSIAAIVVGGSLITGGRGYYVGMIGGVFLLTAMLTLLSGISLPHALKSVFYGMVILAAVTILRDRKYE